MADCEMQPVCKEKFKALETRMNAKSEELDRHSQTLTRLDTNMSQLTRSMQALTKALWGIAGTIFTSFLGFIFWYIQTK